MLKDIIKKEILDHLLSTKFLFMFIICSALILLSVYMGTAEYLADKKVYDDDVAEVRQTLAPPRTYSDLSDGAAHRMFRVPQTLGALVKGVEDSAERMSYISMPEVSFSESKNESDPMTAVFGSFDLMFIVKMVLSLLAILLVYDAICGEKEKGTLKLMLANSVPRDRLLLGKAIGGYISLCVPLLIPLLLSLIYLSLHPRIVLTGEDWQRLTLIFLLFLLYLSVFFCLGLLVSSLTARSSTSLLVLLSVWVMLGMVVPKASVIMADHLRPIPTPNEIYTQTLTFSTQLQREQNQALMQKQQDLLAQLGTTNPQANQELQRVLSEFLTENARVFWSSVGENNARIYREYQLRKDAQAALAKNFSRISPVSSLTFAATTLARTGIDDYNRFEKTVREYKIVFSNMIRTDPDLRGKEIDFAGMPQPALEYESLSQSFIRILPDLISMVVMIALLTGGAYFAFIRCDVR